jgi:hypothetical protein
MTLGGWDPMFIDQAFLKKSIGIDHILSGKNVRGLHFILIILGGANASISKHFCQIWQGKGSTFEPCASQLYSPMHPFQSISAGFGWDKEHLTYISFLPVHGHQFERNTCVAVLAILNPVPYK